VTNATSLTTVSVPSLLFATATVELRGLPRLTTLDLRELGSIGGSLLIESVPVLPNLSGLSALGSIGNALSLKSAGALTSFAGLGALEVVSGDLSITGNAQLSSFTGLGALDEVGEDLTITGNPQLPRQTAQSFASSITVRGAITIN
jgi:hypothetical protein